jgi:PGF-CTERM protein
MGPGEQPISLSVLVNDNDGGERLGWIEWGEGIGMGKDPSKYQAMTFVAGDVDLATPTATPSPEPTPTAESPTPSQTPDANTLTASPEPTDATTGDGGQMATPAPDDETTPTPASSPGFGVVALLAALLAVAVVLVRRQ